MQKPERWVFCCFDSYKVSLLLAEDILHVSLACGPCSRGIRVLYCREVFIGLSV